MAENIQTCIKLEEEKLGSKQQDLNETPTSKQSTKPLIKSLKTWSIVCPKGIWLVLDEFKQSRDFQTSAHYSQIQLLIQYFMII